MRHLDTRKKEEIIVRMDHKYSSWGKNIEIYTINLESPGLLPWLDFPWESSSHIIGGISRR